MRLVFLPDRAAPRFFWWDRGTAALVLRARGKPEQALVVDDALAPHRHVPDEDLILALEAALRIATGETGEDALR